MSTTTEHYGLHQWTAEDAFLRTDFNEDNAKIDTALAGMPKVVVGTYTGDGNSNYQSPTHCTLGFRPKCVIVTTGSTASRTYIGTADTGIVALTDTGFSYYKSSTCDINYSGVVYTYIAFQ